MKEDNLKKYLSSIGLIFPQSEEEQKAFDLTHEKHEFALKEEDIDPDEILKEIVDERRVKSKVKIKNFEYHKRTVLAAEIVFQLIDDNYLGHLKLQKIIFLCQNISKMALQTSFLKQAMGPYDPKLMRSLDAQFKKKEWFLYSKKEFPKYKPLAKCGEHKEWYNKYFNKHDTEICFVIKTLEKLNTNQVELVGTIFACWLEILNTKEMLNNELLIQKVYGWHESKSKFKEVQILNAIIWMREKGIYPQN